MNKLLKSFVVLILCSTWMLSAISNVFAVGNGCRVDNETKIINSINNEWTLRNLQSYLTTELMVGNEFIADKDTKLDEQFRQSKDEEAELTDQNAQIQEQFGVYSTPLENLNTQIKSQVVTQTSELKQKQEEFKTQEQMGISPQHNQKGNGKIELSKLSQEKEELETKGKLTAEWLGTQESVLKQTQGKENEANLCMKVHKDALDQSQKLMLITEEKLNLIKVELNKIVDDLKEKQTELNRIKTQEKEMNSLEQQKENSATETLTEQIRELTQIISELEEQKNLTAKQLSAQEAEFEQINTKVNEVALLINISEKTKRETQEFVFKTNEEIKSKREELKRIENKLQQKQEELNKAQQQIAELERKGLRLNFEKRCIKNENHSVKLTAFVSNKTVLNVENIYLRSELNNAKAVAENLSAENNLDIIASKEISLSDKSVDVSVEKIHIEIFVGQEYDGEEMLVLHRAKTGDEIFYSTVSNGVVSVDVSSLSPFFVFKKIKEIKYHNGDFDSNDSSKKNYTIDLEDGKMLEVREKQNNNAQVLQQSDAKENVNSSENHQNLREESLKAASQVSTESIKPTPKITVHSVETESDDGFVEESKILNYAIIGICILLSVFLFLFMLGFVMSRKYKTAKRIYLNS